MYDLPSADSSRRMPVYNEIRQNPRVATTIEAILLPSSATVHPVHCFILNVSMGGLLLITDSDIESGRSLHIRIHQPICPEMQLFSIKVIHSSLATNRPMTYLSLHGGQTYPSGGHLLGVTFVGLSDIQRAYIAAFLAEPQRESQVDLLIHALLEDVEDHPAELENASPFAISLFLITTGLITTLAIIGATAHLPLFPLGLSILGILMISYGVRLVFACAQRQQQSKDAVMQLTQSQESSLLNDGPNDHGDPFIDQTAS